MFFLVLIIQFFSCFVFLIPRISFEISIRHINIVFVNIHVFCLLSGHNRLKLYDNWIGLWTFFFLSALSEWLATYQIFDRCFLFCRWFLQCKHIFTRIHAIVSLERVTQNKHAKLNRTQAVSEGRTYKNIQKPKKSKDIKCRKQQRKQVILCLSLLERMYDHHNK